ncbi:hypothetical protein AAK894_07140 [Lachnospiraceae bacterium 46-61]
MNFKNAIIRILFFGILLSILMMIVGKIFDLSKTTLFMTLIISYIIFIIIMIPYQMRKGNLLTHKIEVLSHQLQKGDIENYIIGMKKLLNEIENNYLKSILTINMAIGYTLKGEFEQANLYLECIDIESIDKRSQMILYHNIALNAFWAGETKKACIIMESHKDVLKVGLESPYFKNSFRETFALWSFAIGKREQGFTYLENIINEETAKSLEKQSAQVLWAKEKIADNEITEAENLLKYIFDNTKIPYIKDEAKNILQKLNKL